MNELVLKDTIQQARLLQPTRRYVEEAGCWISDESWKILFKLKEV